MKSCELPKGWKRTTVGEVYDFTKKPRGRSYSEKVAFIPMALIPENSLEVSEHELRNLEDISSGTYFEEDDLLVSKITPCFENGKQGIAVNIPNGYGIATTEVIPVKGRAGVSNIYYLAGHIKRQSVRAYLTGKMQGSTGRKRLKQDALETLELLLPPIEEQEATAKTLKAVQRAKEAREAELALERERKAALMAYLLTHGTRREALKQTEIGEMPKSWDVCSLKNCAEKPEYGYTESANNHPVGPKFLRITDIQNGYVDWNNVPYCVCDERTFTKKRLIKDDLVIARIGATTGKAFYIFDCPDQAVYASYLIRVRAQKNVMHPKYFAHFAETPLYWDHINKNKGGKLKGGVNIPILQAMKLPLGSLEEQKEIVDILDAQEKKIRALIEEMKVLNELFHSLLDELMSGKLSVEPLLEPKKVVKKKVAA